MTTQQKIAQLHMMRNHGTNIRHNIHQNMQQRLSLNQQQQQQQQQQHQLQQQQQITQPQFQHPQQQQFTKQAVDVAKDTEKLQNDQQRLTSLHSKLHKEAEKIRQWKSEKEMEIKQKERSLSDAIQTIDSLRKSIIELQFQNEEFSTKLHDKELEKEETEHKMCTVREMANVLRDQMMQLESRIAQGEQDKENVSQINQNMIEENQALVLKFQELDINQATIIEKNKKQLQVLENKYGTEVKDLQVNIRHLENQLISLMDTKTSQEKSIKEYTSGLKENKDLLAKLQEDFSKTTEKLQHAEQVMQSQEQNLITSNAAVEELSVRFKETHQNLIETTNNWKEAEQEKNTQQQHAKEVKDIYSSEINSLQSDIRELSGFLQQKCEEIKNLTTDSEEKNRMISQIKKESNEKELANENLKSKISELENSANELEEIKQDLSEKVNSYSNVITAAESRISTITEECSNLEVQKKLSGDQIQSLNQQKSALEEQLINGQAKLKQLEEALLIKDETMTNYVVQLDQLKLRLEENENCIETLNKLKQDLEKKCNDMTVETDQKIQEIQELKSMAAEKERQFENYQIKFESALNEIQELKETVDEQEKKIVELEEIGQEKTETMQTELAGKEKKAEDLGNKTKSLQSQVGIKTKQVKNLEKENKNLKNQIKKLSDKNLKTEDQLRDLQENAKTTSEILNKSQQELENSKLEQHQSKERYDIDQKEFCATLEQYKLENDKIVEDYLNENSAMKKQLCELQNSISDEQETFRMQQVESNKTVKTQKSTIAALESEINNTVSLKDKKIAELETITTSIKEQIASEQNKNKELEHDYQVLLEKTEEIKCAELAKEGNGNDRMVPTTPKINTGHLEPITPQSILRNSQSNRGKRVLFAGVHKSDETLPMETDIDEAPMKHKPKTPTIPGNKMKLSNIRFSPKPSPSLIKKVEDERKAHSPGPQIKTLNRISRKAVDDRKSDHVGKFKSTNIKEVVEGHYNATQKSPKITKNICNTPKGAISRIKKGAGKTGSPGEVKQIFHKNKMKKMMPNIKKTNDQNLSWFDTDNVFGFDS